MSDFTSPNDRDQLKKFLQYLQILDREQMEAFLVGVLVYGGVSFEDINKFIDNPLVLKNYGKIVDRLVLFFELNFTEVWGSTDGSLKPNYPKIL